MRFLQLELCKVPFRTTTRPCGTKTTALVLGPTILARVASTRISQVQEGIFPWRTSLSDQRLSSRQAQPSPVCNKRCIRHQHTAAIARDDDEHNEASVHPDVDSSSAEQSQSTPFPAQAILAKAFGSGSIDAIRHSLATTPISVPVRALIQGNRFIAARITELITGDSTVAKFTTCPTFKFILPRLAPILGLEYLTFGQGDDFYLPETAYNSYLIKTKDSPTNVSPKALSSLQELLKYGIWSVSFNTFVRDTDLDGDSSELPTSYWRLLTIACKGYAKAMPLVRFASSNIEHEPQWLAPGPEAEGSSRYLVMSSNHYNISVWHEVVGDESPYAHAFGKCLLDYCSRIERAIAADPSPGLRFDHNEWEPAEYLGRALRALSWGSIGHDEDKIDARTLSESFEMRRSTVKLHDRGHLGPTAVWSSKDKTRLLSIMHACYAVGPALEDAYRTGALLPEEYKRFARHWSDEVSADDGTSRQSQDSSPQPMTHILSVDGRVISKMLDTLRSLRDIGCESAHQWPSADDTFEPQPRKQEAQFDHLIPSTSPREFAPPSRVSSRPSLPVTQYRTALHIRDTIRRSDITIIKAATGSGKTTQIPQLILDETKSDAGYACNIVCTQPRRVATTTVANRVASERGKPLGDEVGYQVRFDNRPPVQPNGITYMTSGYLLRSLEADPVDAFRRYTHIILDEVHERDVDTDLLLTALQNRVDNPLPGLTRMPKIVLMSATIDSNFFERYFRKLTSRFVISCIDIPGKAYDVEEKMLQDVLPRLVEQYPQQTKALLQDNALKQYLDSQNEADKVYQLSKVSHQQNVVTENPGSEKETDKQSLAVSDEMIRSYHVPTSLLALLIGDILRTTTTGDILVFLPGLAEIEHLEHLLIDGLALGIDFVNTGTYVIFKLHSALYETNNLAFQDLPEGKRRIVLATNIAETSITLPAVKYVLDTGYSRVSSYDQSAQTGSFGTRWISKAEVAQRRGRAGRTQPGTYIGTFSRAQFEAMRANPVPELLRSALDQVVLRIQASKAYHVNQVDGTLAAASPGTVLALAPSPPDPIHVSAAAQQLTRIHALAENGQVTPMGKVMSRIPTTPAASKSILLSLLFRCLDPMLVIGTMRDDFAIMHHAEKTGVVATARKKLANGVDDDRLADSRAFFLYDYARKSGSQSSVQAVKTEYYVRHDAYCDMAQTAKQTFETLRSVLGHFETEPVADLARGQMLQPLYTRTPAYLNVNSTKEDLLKALVLSTSGSRIAIWERKNWRTATRRRVLVIPRSVNHTSGRKETSLQRLRREPGDILTYATIRIVASDKYPWAVETSIVSPLTGMLFAESLRLSDKDVLIINDWAKYKIEVNSTDTSMTSTLATKVILEYRKAMDRFIAFALSKVALQPSWLKVVQERKMKPKEFNQFFTLNNHPVRKLMVDSAIDILEIDSQNRKARAAARIAEAESEIESP